MAWRAATLRAVSVAAKAAVTALLIWLVLRQTDIGAVSERMSGADLSGVVAELALLAGMSVVAAWRWATISRAVSPRLPFVRATRFLFIGLFFNQTLPSSVGGDAFRVWLVHRTGAPLGDALASVVVDRTFGLSALAVTALLGLPVLVSLPGETEAVVAVAVLAGAAAAGLLFLAWLGGPAGSWLRARKWIRALGAVASGIRAVLSSRRVGPFVVAQSIVVHLVLVCAAAVLLWSLGRPVAFGLLLGLVPVVMLFAVIPVSLAGWGVREGAMVVALGLAGVPAADALALSVMLGLGLFIVGLPGGVLWLRSERRLKPAPNAGAATD